MTSYLSRILLLAILSQPLCANTSPSKINSIAAIVNDDVITSLELGLQVSTIKKQLHAQRARLPPEHILRKQVLEREVLKQIQLQFAKNTGIRIDDNELNTTLSRIAQQNKLSLPEFRDALENDGLNFAQFREDIRSEMIIARLQQREIQNRITISNQEVENFLATQASQGNIDDEYNLSHILISVPEAANADQIDATLQRAQKILARLDAGEEFQQVAISASDGQKALEGGELGWRKAGQLPTLFATLVTHMSPGEHSGLIRSSSGFHIIRLNAKRSGKKHLVTQTKARHILIRPNELNTARDIITRLSQLRTRIINGADFDELAKSHSEDRGSAVNGGDLGWVSPGQMVPQFENAMNKLEPGEISEPFQSQFGWHIVQVLERRNTDNSEQFIQNKAREFIRQRKTEEMTEAWLRQIREEAFVSIKIPD
ncbi:MAG TPA: molecular chaperone SurA [Gammaproteobacteria bacterium]|nr:molecular chaperone SurA [Gammaproteobacteria bacterium]